ncbi:Pleckstrin homology domain-containing protein [Perilla frutescens var. hirtella]|uniref:Pleckstrin homology domain-containing protein n=1 Tax=Perilla frutescens var. hirtella TaxID=608512 RepID=A0AAD4IS61_PERFH|nr:Pleckstrin homology domain-containing protein [Perilla frutescens var. frutescens]KAH6820487.1 Pleckstrin homology domain-containing protein [Perilla frutescens var. hirtella]
MGDGPRGIQVFPDYFAASTSGSGSPSTPSQASSITTELRSQSHTWARRRLKSATSMLNLFNLRGRLSWKLGANGDEKVVLSAVEVESLRSEIAALEERESHFKAQLEHIDEILRSARLSGYLHLRMRWAALPGEPLPIDDTEVDDWLPRFIVLHGSCIYLYMIATDLSPQDSTLLSDVVEVGRLPCLTREEEVTRYCFYILTRHGLRYECSSTSKIQVESWLEALQIDCKLALGADDLNDPKV